MLFVQVPASHKQSTAIQVPSSYTDRVHLEHRALDVEFEILIALYNGRPSDMQTWSIYVCPL